MFLERTISQLDIGPVPSDRAHEMARLGFLQWLAGFPKDADYRREAMHAYDMAKPFAGTSPAIAVFCDLLAVSMRNPCEPLPLELPPRRRRGGTKARRSWRTTH